MVVELLVTEELFSDKLAPGPVAFLQNNLRTTNLYVVSQGSPEMMFCSYDYEIPKGFALLR